MMVSTMMIARLVFRPSSLAYNTQTHELKRVRGMRLVIIFVHCILWRNNVVNVDYVSYYDLNKQPYTAQKSHYLPGNYQAMSVSASNRMIIKVSGHQCQWLASG